MTLILSQILYPTNVWNSSGRRLLNALQCNVLFEQAIIDQNIGLAKKEHTKRTREHFQKLRSDGTTPKRTPDDQRPDIQALPTLSCKLNLQFCFQHFFRFFRENGRAKIGANLHLSLPWGSNRTPSLTRGARL